MERTMTEFLQDNWRALLTLAGFIGLAKSTYDTNKRLDRAVFDDDGSYRLVKVNDCKDCRIQCQQEYSDHFKSVEAKLDRLLEMVLKQNVEVDK
jgi:hypothetical protein